MVRRPRSWRLAARALVAPLVGGLLAVGAVPVLLDAPAAAACAPAAAAAASTPRAAATAAVAWLLTQIQPDGGFEVAGFPGFETPDAVLAIAEAGQTGPTWSTAEALAAVRAVSGSCGENPLAWLDEWSRSGISGGDAAKLVVFVSGPLGLPSAAFDPAGDGAPVDLTALIAAAQEPDGWYGTFGETIDAAIALRILDAPVPAATTALLRAAQHLDGSWDYTGDLATDTPADVNTTAAALMALLAAGAAQDDPAVVRSLAYLALRQQPDGGWREDGDAVTNPNATALAAAAIRTAGYDPDGSAWRPAVPAGAATAAAVVGTPTEALIAAQQPDGHLAGPYDEFGLNTFGTTQGVQGILRGWLVGAVPLAGPTDTTTTTAPTTTTVAASGRLANSGSSTGGIALAGLLALALGGALLSTRRRLA